jgi:hypothetical protein
MHGVWSEPGIEDILKLQEAKLQAHVDGKGVTGDSCRSFCNPI